MDIFVIETKIADKISMEELKKFQKKEISNSEKLVEHCLAYMMLDRILRDAYDLTDTSLYFDNNKPYLLSGELYFSISHSQEYIAIAFSQNDCGVDIEKVTLRDFGAIAERMEFECNTLEEFYEEWTKFEAEYKLGETCSSYGIYNVEDYIVTGVSADPDEEFQLYMEGADEDNSNEDDK